MKPVYFPHTYLAPSAADALRSIFPSVAVYQAAAGREPEEMRALVEDGFLEVVAPAPGDQEEFDRLIRDFQDWGRVHRYGAGLEAALLQGHPFWGPSGADGSTYEIASQLRRRVTAETAASKADAGLAARVFLQLAQAADQQRHQIAGDLARFDKARTQFFDALKGEADPTASEFEQPKADAMEHDGDDHLELRTVAWARLFLNDPYPSPIFVTHSPRLIRHLAETVQGCLRVGREGCYGAAGKTFSGLPPVADDIMSHLSALATGAFSVQGLPVVDAEEESSGSPAGEACVYLWPELPPFGFFNRLLPASAPACGQPPPQALWRHTIIVQIRLKSHRE